MARRRKQESILEDAIKQPWPFSAVLSAAALFFGQILIPSLFAKNPILGALGGVFIVFANVLALLFGGIALFKFAVAQNKPAKHNGESVFRTPTPFHGKEPQNCKNPDPTAHDNVWGGKAEPQTRSRPSTVRPQSSDNAWGQMPDAQARPKPKAWSLEVLQNVEWKLFEDLCAAYYREKGIRCNTTPLGPDGGVDIRLFQDDTSPTRTTAIVQCKAMRIVGIKPMRELLGVMAHEKLEKGFFMTSGQFTDDTKVFGQQNRIVPVDGKLLLAMIQRLPMEAQQRLLDLATQGAWTTPTCPGCGQKMVKRKPDGKKPFWGCGNFPKCRGKLWMRAEAM